MQGNEPSLGYWWLPDSDERWAGNLIQHQDGNIDLEILVAGVSLDMPSINVLHGVVGRDSYSILNLIPWSQQLGLGSTVGTKIIFRAAYALKGVHLEVHDQQFARLSFSVEGLQDWSRLTGINKVWTQEGNLPAINRSYSHSFPDSIDIESGDLKFRFSSMVSEPSAIWSFSLTEDTQIEVTTDNPRAIWKWLSDAVFPIQRLVQMFARTGGRPQRIEVSVEFEDLSPADRPRNWLQVSSSLTKSYPYEPKNSWLEQPLAELRDFQEEPEALKQWLDFERKYREPIAAALDTRLGEPTNDYVLFVYSRLLERLVSRYQQAELCDKSTIEMIAAYAVDLVPGDDGEVLARKILGTRNNDARVPLAQALSKWSDLIIPNAADVEVEWIASRIIDTRNHFAHHRQRKLTKKHIQPREMKVFTSLVKTLIDCEILDRLGLDVSDSINRIRESRQFRNAKLVHDVWLDRGTESSSA